MNLESTGETEPRIPEDLCSALAAEPDAQAAWEGLTTIGRRDFVGWINEAKQAETRARRIVRACENLIAGKKRPCCYAVVPMDLYKALGADPRAKAMWGDLSAGEKRDVSEWIEASPDREARKVRIAEACALLAEGRRPP